MINQFFHLVQDMKNVISKLKSYETISKIHFLLGVGFTALYMLIFWKTKRQLVNG